MPLLITQFFYIIILNQQLYATTMQKKWSAWDAGRETSNIVTTIIIARMKNNWIDHVLRREGFLREVTECRMEWKRPRGRRRMGILEEIQAIYDKESYIIMNGCLPIAETLFAERIYICQKNSPNSYSPNVVLRQTTIHRTLPFAEQLFADRHYSPNSYSPNLAVP